MVLSALMFGLLACSDQLSSSEQPGIATTDAKIAIDDAPGGGSDAGPGELIEDDADGTPDCSDGACDCPGADFAADLQFDADVIAQVTARNPPRPVAAIDAPLNGWACEYQNGVGFEAMCQRFVNMGAANDRYRFRNQLGTHTATIFERARAAPTHDYVADPGFTRVARLSYYWVGHSSPARGVTFVDFAAAAIPQAAAASLYYFTNSGCSTFNLMNYQAIKTRINTQVKPLVETHNKTAVICANQMTSSLGDTVLDVGADGSGNVLTNRDKSRICFEIGHDGRLFSYIRSNCNPGAACDPAGRAWPAASRHAYCRDSRTGGWACQYCRAADSLYESRPIAECNTAAGE